MVYTIKTKEFEGPLEVLLELIESKKLSVNEVSLAEVTDGYFAYLKNLEYELLERQSTYNELTAFLIVASTLILIKSRSLLPGFAITKDEEEDISELTSRLEEYRKIKETAMLIENHILKRTPVFSREPYKGITPEFLPPKTFSLETLPEILKSMLAALPKKEKLPQEHMQKVISLEEKIKELTYRIQKDAIYSFSDLVGKGKEKVDIIVSFLAMLELIKLGALAVEQGTRFSPISIKRLL